MLEPILGLPNNQSVPAQHYFYQCHHCSQSFSVCELSQRIFLELPNNRTNSDGMRAA